MALINSGFSSDEPTELTTPLEKLIRVGFGVDRDEPIVEIEVQIDEEPEVETEAPEAPANHYTHKKLYTRETTVKKYAHKHCIKIMF